MSKSKASPKKTQKRRPSIPESDDADDVEFSDEEGGYRIDDIYIPPPPKPACSVENTGPRIIITKIVNEFFKSYAQETVLGPFHKCFHAIVGPNGSGKSNVIDSMLFVFGYRASKIRSKKLSVLLHNSEAYRNVQSCTVAVHFAQIIDKEGDAYDVVPGSEFVIARTANKDNSSYYTLNGRRVQFKEVATVLRSHSIDLDHNRFLILQGEVEQISMMKTKAANEHETGMLEYLEDIIGTTRYKTPLQKLQERVEILSEQRLEKVNRLKLVENEVQELKGPMEEAVGFLKLENSIISTKNCLYQRHIYDADGTFKDNEVTRAEHAAAQTELVNKLTAISETKTEKESSLRKQTKKYEHLQERKETLKAAFDKANNQDVQLQADMTQLNKVRKKTKELLAEERRKLDGYERAPAESAKGIADYEAREIQLIAQREKLEEEKTKLLASLRSETAELQEKKDVLQTQLVELNKHVDETKSAFTLADSELKIYVSNEESEQKKFETLKTTYENAESTIIERTEQVASLKKKVPATQKSLDEATADLQAVKLEEAQVITQIRQKRFQVGETKSSMQASRSRNRVLDSLMQQKREGNCPGLFGRLGDLGAIAQMYDVAVSTACGPLDNIVVDSVNTAQWCIEFLKKHDIGRATFIALDKQEHLRGLAESRIDTPENVPRLYDLIQIEDERVRTAFYYGLRDTLVAKDIDQASRIAYGARRYRVVTLGGDLIETTGTMSGGGRNVMKGRMGQSVAVSTSQPINVEAMEAELQELENTVRHLRNRQTQIEGQINILQPELRQMKIDLDKYTIELQSLKQQQPMLQQQVKAQEAKAKSTKADPAQVKKLTAVVDKNKDLYDAALADTVEIQEQVDDLTKEIKARTVGKMKSLDKNLNEVIKTIDKCKAEITRLKVALKTAERNGKKSVEKIATMESDITNAEDNLKKMKEKRDEIEKDAKELLICIEEISGQLIEGEDEFSDLIKEVAAMTKKENKLKADKIEIDEKVKTVSATLEQCKAEIRHWKAKLAQLKLQEIPDETPETLRIFTKEELAPREIGSIQKELQSKEEKFRAAKPNLNAILEYRKKQAVYVERTKELFELTEKKNQMKEQHDNLRLRRKEEFIVGYNIIRMKLKEMYQMITLGGDADFEMVDTFDPFTEGIQFNVRPPKKSWKSISNLSGGEKTLSSLALVFALHYYKPSPLYVMDEIDAALDFKNVSIVGNYIKERTKNAQFIIISLRSNMFELCDYLTGIYKTYNCTKSRTIDPRSPEEKAEREKAERDRVERDRAEREKAEREKVEKEKAAREKASEKENPLDRRSSGLLNGDSLTVNPGSEVPHDTSVAVTDRSVAVTDRSVDVTGISVDVTDKSVDVTGMSVDVTGMNVDVTGMNVDVNAEQNLYVNPEKSGDVNTEKSVDVNTEKSVDVNAEKSVPATERRVDANEGSANKNLEGEIEADTDDSMIDSYEPQNDPSAEDDTIDDSMEIGNEDG